MATTKQVNELEDGLRRNAVLDKQFVVIKACECVRAGGKDVLVGIVHNVFWTEPKGTGILYAHVR